MLIYTSKDTFRRKKEGGKDIVKVKERLAVPLFLMLN